MSAYLSMQQPSEPVQALVPPGKPKVLLAYRRSLYELYVVEHDDARIRELVEQGHASVASLEPAHRRQQAALAVVLEAFERQPIELTKCYRGDLPEVDVSRFDLLVVVGGDGTTLDASHFAGACPVLSINPDPMTSVGSLCSGTFEDAEDLAKAYVDGRLGILERARMQVLVNHEPVAPPALNDVLFCHSCAAATSKYIIDDGRARERHMSSGVWVSTATGSTAAIRSAGGALMADADRRLQYRVRELYAPSGEHFDLTHGFIEEGLALELIPRMRTGYVYVDGPHIQVPVTFGDHVELRLADVPLRHVRRPR